MKTPNTLPPFQRSFSRWTWVSQYQNVSIPDYIGAKNGGGGGNNQGYKTCNVPVKLSPSANQHPVFYRPDTLPVAQPTLLKELKGKTPNAHVSNVDSV